MKRMGEFKTRIGRVVSMPELETNLSYCGRDFSADNPQLQE